MKQLALLLFITFTSFEGICQQLTWTQPIQVGWKCHSLEADSEGNLYFAGEINNSVIVQRYFNDVKLPIHSNYYNYGFIIKANSEYQHEWIKIIEGYAFSTPLIKVDKEGNVVVFGAHNGKLKIDSNEIVPAAEAGFFIAKFDASGNLLWHSSIGSTSFKNAIDIKIDDNGNIYVAGDASGQLIFYNGSTVSAVVGNSPKSIFYAKFSADGDFDWVKAVPDGDNDIGLKSMELDKNGNVYLSGWWYRGGTFESIQKVPNKSMLFIAKFNSERQLQWLKQIGGPTSTTFESANSVALDENLNSIYVTGNFIGSADFGGKVLTANDENIFLARYSMEGDLIWVKKMGSWSGLASGTEFGWKLLVDREGFIYLSGTIGKNGNFEGVSFSAYENNSSNSFMAKYTASGKLLWITLTGHDIYTAAVFDFIRDNNNNILIGGTTSGGVKFGDQQLFSDHYYDIGYACKFAMPIERFFDVSKTIMVYEASENLESTFEIVSNLNWTLSYNAPWLTASTMSGMGNTILALSAEANSSSENRSTILKVVSEDGIEKTIVVSQTGDNKLITSIDEVIKKSEFVLYPNPVDDFLQISTDINLHTSTIVISDITGKELLFKQIADKSIYVGKLKPGVYLLKIRTPQFQLLRKFVKL
jgi:hypothetical protein